MIKKGSVYAVYNEKLGKLELVNEDAEDEKDKIIEGKVYINHDSKEIRLYNFRKYNLTNKEKVEILYGILEESVLFPNSLFSQNNTDGKLGEYTILINGYLLNGEFKEKDKKYNSIITELLDNTKHYADEPKCIEYYREKIRSFYNKNKNILGKEKVKLELSISNRIKGYIEYVNIVKLLSTYLKEKGIIFRMRVNKKLFSRNIKIYILPC